MQVLLLEIFDQHVVDAFERHRRTGEQLLDVIGGLVDARVAEHHQRACAWPRHQAYRGLQDRGARALGTDQRAGRVEPVLRQKLVEIVARDAARNLGILRAHLLCVTIAQRDQAAIDLAFAPRRPGLGAQLGLVELVA